MLHSPLESINEKSKRYFSTMKYRISCDKSHHCTTKTAHIIVTYVQFKHITGTFQPAYVKLQMQLEK